MIKKSSLQNISCLFTLLSSLIVLPTISEASPVSATIQAGNVQHPVINVTSNGRTYNDVSIVNPGRQVVIPVYVRIDTRDEGEGSDDASSSGSARSIDRVVFSSFIEHGIGIDHPVTYPSSDLFHEVNYFRDDPRVRVFDDTLYHRVSVNPLRGHAQDMCNQVAQSMRRQGSTNTEIFSRDRVAYFNVDSRVHYYIKDPELVQSQRLPPKRIRVNCLKDTGIGDRTEGGDIYRVKHISATVRKNTGDACKITLRGELLTTAPRNTLFRYQIMFNGRLSDRVFTTRTRSNKVAHVAHQFSVNGDPRSFDLNNQTAPSSGRFQIVSDSLRSKVAAYSINCLLPAIDAGDHPDVPRFNPGVRENLQRLR